jgi:protein-S-isoprenylcysteine O-methyltransferase Ste14
MTIIQLFQWVTFASLLFWLLVYWQAGRKILADIRNALKSGNSRMDIVLLILMVVFSFIITATAFLTILEQVKFGFPRNINIPAWLTAAGCFLTILGVAGTFYCRRQLGQFWTAETALKKDHRVMDQGAYGIVRHPIYTFAIILYIGLGLVFATWWNLICAAGVVLAYMLKAKNEETFLEKSLAGYAEYKRRVRYRLIPGIW